MQTLLSVIGLGFLGLDPVAAALVYPAISAHVKRRKLLLFLIAFLLGTTGFGLLLSLIGQEAVDYIQSLMPGDLSPLWAVLNLIIVLVIIVWISARYIRRDKKRLAKKHRWSKYLQGSGWRFVIVGLVFAFSALTDPTFYAVVMIAAETHNAVAMAGLHFLWITISQIPLLALVAAYYLGLHKKLVRTTTKLWKRHRNKAGSALYIAAISVAVLLLIDVVVYIVSGNYFL